MKHRLVTVTAIAGLAASTASWSKGDIKKIAIERIGAATAVEITEPEVLDRFAVWSGPGVVGWDMTKTIPQPDEAAFIVDWTLGTLAGVPTLATYKVTLYVDRYDPPCNKYEVLYRVDSRCRRQLVSLVEGVGRRRGALRRSGGCGATDCAAAAGVERC